MHAVDDLSDAIDATREFLTPARPGLWLRLAVIVFFVSSLGFGGPSVPAGDVQMTTDGEFLSEFESEFEAETGEEVPWEELVLALVLIGLVVFGIWLVYALLAAIMEFVFIQSLSTSTVHVRRYFRENLGRGLRLFGFRIALLLLASLVALVPSYLLVSGAGGLSALSGVEAGAVVLFGGAVALSYAVVNRFTSEFVAPVMLLEERGVLSAWRRFLSALAGNWAEYVVYLLLVWILNLVISITVWFVVGISLLAFAIPVVVVAVVLVAALGDLAAIPVLLLVVLALISFLVFVALVWVPITTYFQYYALLLLGDTDPELDLIPDQREAVRDGEPGIGVPDDSDGNDGWGAAGGKDDGWNGGNEDDSRSETDDDGWSTWDETSDRDEDDENRGW
ncbi:hypothetical protein OB905_04445 [Halobacteria archaeon AArc-dxtr1]|nr:hypothetical protein [Halobacteria archaeon AArc-dxtr1]